MHEIGVDFGVIADALVESESPVAGSSLYTVDDVEGLLDELRTGLRRCYVSDEAILEAVARHGRDADDVLAAIIPARPPVMAGDFGEVIAALFLAAQSDVIPYDPKKWRLKQKRDAPAPGTDVVQFHVPDWPNSSDADKVAAAEVKTKSTDGSSTPISAAVEGSRDDRDARLANTLVWLRQRAMTEDLGSVSLELLERFIAQDEHPEAGRTFHAVAVICSSLVHDEMDNAPPHGEADIRLIIISVPDLRALYRKAFAAVGAGDLGGNG